ncbi:hypothetical protein KAFR_0E03130 [Kazachstania africana CBS 2517]|uniref:F-box domain-containing protein n=1 Tax=Kazachstania africana (strain ATCC 22294 / BCRC 22015 / CBS 2517 / CECT 1963 / NBRC 1671 / NRRL Y-8276) TaxID=1071382 RepID=H2AVR5_KAZAF|nr:hypothetical protein KAFR_0E03130 [Kazachstania africana CBS 2517]CCF58465.1 hypothetical protein KAFR_0E03130 [Kazachstania africana CBS 2517]
MTGRLSNSNNNQYRKMQSVNFVGTNYSRYGTSVYKQLYGNYDKYDDSEFLGARYKHISVSPKKRNILTNSNSNLDRTTDNVLSKKDVLKKKYKSLISTSSKKLKNKFYNDDAFSIFSNRSHSKHPIIVERYAELNDLPIEIINYIMSFIEDDKILIYCLYVSKKFYAAAKPNLYSILHFTSTYRVAQFVTSLRLHPENGNYVKYLDLSDLKNGLILRESKNKTIVNADDAVEEDDDNDEPLKELAYASWRDWRFRNDPLYSSPILNCYNLKKVSSRSSSVSSASTTFESNLNIKRLRSNSSVSSFTSNIMSSIQPSHSNANMLLPKIDSITNDKSNRGGHSSQNSKWFRLKLGYKNRAKSNALKLETDDLGPTDIDHNRVVTFKETERERPFKTKHPYTNKFLLKYAQYRDLPLGYILHILKLCPNLVGLNLSNLSLYTDFKVTHNVSNTINRQFSTLIADSTPTVELENKEDNLDVVYLTDSSKIYEPSENKRTVSSSSQLGFSNANSWISTNAAFIPTKNWPLPIDSNTKLRGSQNKRTDYELTKVQTMEIFQHLSCLTELKINNVVWCTQSMIKSFILDTFVKSRYNVDLSFEKSGMNRNFVWSCKGNLDTFVTLVALDELLKRDDFEIESIFNIRRGNLQLSQEHKEKNTATIEKSAFFEISYDIENGSQKTISVSLEILKNDPLLKPTTLDLKKIAENRLHISVNLRLDENFSGMMVPNEILPKKSDERIDRLAHALLFRVMHLRSGYLRRNVGENSYLSESMAL